jgi:predicted lipoprotein with Yx(FWY)xxD motif
VKRISGFISQGAIAISLAAMIAGCGGGGTSGLMSSPQGGGGGGGGSGANQPLATTTINGGPGFVNSNGHTVYVFDADLAVPGTSQCNGACATNWPSVPPPATALPSGWTAITRSDNTMQLAYNGRPLYTYIGDTMSGQANGDGITAFGGIWHVARPAGTTGMGGGGGGY